MSGKEKWNSSDNVKRVRFTIPNIVHLLRNEEKIETLSLHQRHRTQSDNEILRIRTTEAWVSATYIPAYSSWGYNVPTDISISFEVEYHESRPLGDHLKMVQDITRFFVFALGLPLTPQKIFVSRLSFDDLVRRLENEHLIDEHQHHITLQEYAIDEVGYSHHTSPFHARDDKELSALALSLQTWLNRADKWRESYAHMSECARQRNSFTSERVLSADRWLAKIPTAKQPHKTEKNIIDSITKVALDEADRLERADMKHRISNALRMLASESHREKLERLVQYIGFEFRSKSEEQWLNDLAKLREFRGKAAHGLLDFRTDEEFLGCARAVSAVEALCFLLTLKELPISDFGRDLSSGNRFISDYMNIL